nr:TIGR02597 family protein [Verrucomicrobium spinosum]
MKPKVFLLAAFVAAVSTQGISMAAEVSTDPLGVFTFETSGNSDSYVYLPLRRVPEFVGTVATVSKNGAYDVGEPFTDTNNNSVRDSGEVFVDTDNVVTLSGTPGLISNQFVYAAGTQPKHFYMLVSSGSRAGMYYTVLANGVGTLTVDAAGDNLLSTLAAGATVDVVPFQTLSSIFPAGGGVHPCSTHSIANRQSEILIPDNGTAGKDLAAVVSYYYFSGSTGAGPGWRRAGAASVLANDDVLLPDTFFIIRHNIATPTTVKMLGGVQMATLSTPLNVSAGLIRTTQWLCRSRLKSLWLS